MLQKDIHANCVAIRHNQETGFSCQWFNCSIHISVFPNMMTRHGRSSSFSAPTIFRFVDTTKARFILEHQADFFRVVENFLQFCYPRVNFFEASMASGSARFGCLLLGIFFVHPCRCSTVYICPCPVSCPIFSSYAAFIPDTSVI